MSTRSLKRAALPPEVQGRSLVRMEPAGPVCMDSRRRVRPVGTSRAEPIRSLIPRSPGPRWRPHLLTDTVARVIVDGELYLLTQFHGYFSAMLRVGVPWLRYFVKDAAGDVMGWRG